MKRLLLLFGLLMVGGFLPALAGQHMTVLSVSAADGVSYRAEDGTNSAVFPGQRLPATGGLSLSAGREVRLVYDDQRIILEGPTEVEMPALIERAKSAPQRSFLGRFWTFISSSVTNTEKVSDVENYHRRHLTNTRAGIEGMAEGSAAVRLPAYLQRAFASPRLDLKWSAIGGATGYALSVKDRTTEEQLLAVRIRDTVFTLPLDQLLLNPEDIYRIRIAPISGPDSVRSAEVFFSYEPERLTEVVTNLKKRKNYREMTPREQELFEVYTLEQKEFLEAADARYRELLAEHPADELYRRAYAAFLIRMDDPVAAKLMLKL